MAVGARPCRARLLTGSQLGLESKRPSREELARALEAVRTLPFGSNYLASAAYRRHVAGVEVPAPLEGRFEDEAKALGAEGVEE